MPRCTIARQEIASFSFAAGLDDLIVVSGDVPPKADADVRILSDNENDTDLGGREMDPTIEKRTMAKVYWRVLPLAMVVYFLCYLDRINISFAALTMNKDLGLTAAVYGISSTAFYIGYCLFEIPSNIVLDKVGARLWIARIMITWGLVSGATAFAVGANSFMTIRFLLGAAEAGLFPGIILYFTYWFPDRHRARIVAGFTLALPVSVALGAPISTAILSLDGAFGIAGWKWIYLLEAVPTVLLGVVVLLAMTDKPAIAGFLSPEEKAWLVGTAAIRAPRGRGEAQVQPVGRATDAEDPAAVGELSRHRHGEPGPAAVRSADHQVARGHQHGNGVCHLDRLCLRRAEHDVLRLALGPDR